jgi:IS5 family transposase
MVTTTDDFFYSRFDQMIDLRRPLAVPVSRMPWQEIEASLSHRFARTGKEIEDIDLFGAAAVALSAGGVSKAVRPRLPRRLIVPLLSLNHAFNESDEGLVETPTWQYFSGQAYFEHRWPCDSTLWVKFRKPIGEEGVEELLARTIEAAMTMNLIAKKELSQVIVDSAVQEKAITHPTDSELYVDLGYWGEDQANIKIAIKRRGKFKSLTDEERKNLKRRQGKESVIGHLQADHRINRFHLKGARGDSLHAVLYATGYSIHWLVHMITKKGACFLPTFFWGLLEHSGLTSIRRWAAKKIAKFGGEMRGQRRLDATVSLAFS